MSFFQNEIILFFKKPVGTTTGYYLISIAMRNELRLNTSVNDHTDHIRKD